MATTIEKHVGAATTDTSNVSLTVRLIMQGKEVGSIIGKKGEIVKRFRDESGAKINISDGSCPERIVTVTGHTDSIYKAFTLICNKFEEDLANLVSPNTVPKPPITFRLIVPASQCGSLIGKGGSKIREIREVTGASIQVASEMLPNSTERAVTISGGSDAITQCVYHICCVMTESPPKGITVPYRPLKPVTVATNLGPQQAMIQNNVAVSAGGFLPVSHAGQYTAAMTASLNPATVNAAHAALIPASAQAGKLGSIQLASLQALNGLGGFAGSPGQINPAALAALAGHHQQGRPQTTQQTHEMTVPNELIGCIIGKGGSKIAEIRQLSGAMIRISNCEDRDPNNVSGNNTNMDRTITITGNAESVALAQYLINMSMEIHKANLEAQNTTRAILRPPATTIIPNYPQAQFNAAAALVGQNPVLIPTVNVSSANYATAITNSILSQQQATLTPSSGVMSSPTPPNIAQSQPSLQLTAATNSCYTSNGSLMSTSGSGVTPNPVQQIAVSNSLPMAYHVSKPSAAAAVAAAQAAAVAQAQAAQIAVNSNASVSNQTSTAIAPQQCVLTFPNHNNQLYYLAAQQAVAVQNGTDPNPTASIAGNSIGNFLQQDLHTVSPFSSQAVAAAAAAQASGMNHSAIAAAQAAAAVAARTNTIPASVSNPAVASYHVTPKLKSPSGMLTITSGRGSDKFAPY